ncbi:ABC transporter permease [Streptococcus salivarius]|uniref:ABC transporter permease n=1 Tax=Streptococcus salivarius TaxID=1304 RepID=UPI0039C14F94
MRKINLIKFDINYNILKKPVILVYLYLFPIVLFYLLSKITAGNFSIEITSLQYYGLNILIYFQLTMGTMVSNMIMEESVKLPNMRISYAFSNENYIYVSKIIALTLMNSLSILFYMLFLMFVYKINFGANPVVLFSSYNVVGFLSICLGTVLCIALKDESLCNNILGVVQILICIFGGIFFPVSYLGNFGRILSKISIANWINLGVGQYVFEDNTQLLFVICILSLIFSIILLLIARKLFKIEEFL